MQDEATFRQARSEELQALSKKVTSAVQPADLQEKTIQRLTQDLADIQVLNTKLALLKDTKDIPWSLLTNEMNSVLQGAQALLDQHGKELLSGQEIPGYNFIQHTVTRLGSPTSLFGTPKGTFFTCALISLSLDLDPHNKFPVNVDLSSLVYIIPLPPSDPPLLHPRCSYSFSDKETPQGLIVINGGYAGRGLKKNARYPKGRPHAPQDCSSWVSKCVDAPWPFTTLDEYRASNLFLQDPEREAWAQTPLGSFMLNTFEPIDPQNVQLGDIYFHRTFGQKDNTMTGPGTDGHTGIILGVLRNGKIIIMARSRRIPEREGLGIQECPFKNIFPTQCGILRVQSKKAVSGGNTHES